ncbi:MAG: tRNA (adenosine(37)-N6)-dimethylallyltransferase MiaA [Bacteroidales bacterium]|nr:tRNA (adenosine(37)-N6)-dimethylallyltransferase MiaA [Bacteroidales bacterium]
MKDSSEKYNLIVVLGPTATGKTRFAAELASRIGGEIISADSRQVYKHMDLGTGKDYADYFVDGTLIPHHLIDLFDPGYKYNVFEFQKDFIQVYEDIRSRGTVPILCGGTGMYIEAVTKGYRLISVPVNADLRASLEGKSLHELEGILSQFKKLHNKTDTDTLKRAVRAIEIETYYAEHPETDMDYPEIKPVYLGIRCDRGIRRKRITQRLKTRLQEGMIDEVKGLLDRGISGEDLLYYGLEYKFVTQYLRGELDYETMFQKLNVAIHQFAKRQMTWFRKMEREGIEIHWIDSEQEMERKLQIAGKHLNLPDPSR